MPAESDEPLRRVTLNLYKADVEWMETHYGRGWTEEVRLMVHRGILKVQELKKERITGRGFFG